MKLIYAEVEYILSFHFWSIQILLAILTEYDMQLMALFSYTLKSIVIKQEKLFKICRKLAGCDGDISIFLLHLLFRSF